ncbi:MAG: gliding motility-associated C-terminal domain-containing protein [Saprospiraceae bacterium]|nr:gliding motility-associated C-terminal domain-containing protein [Saprospiraceae bacterium]
MKRHLFVLAVLIFGFGNLAAQSNFINQDSVFARTSDCTSGVSVCVDSIAYDNINDLRFFVNGQQFSTQFTPCLVNTVHNYSYSDIFRGGEGGPWRLDSWTVNGRTYTGRFNNLQTLLDSMRGWNPSGNWELENSARIIYGYVAASTTYSCQEIFGIQKGGQSQVCYNSGIEYRGLRFNVPVGVHQLIVEKVRTGERDTVTLLAACLKPETIRRTVAVGSSATYCASQADLLGTLVSTRNYCAAPANAITFGTPQATCSTYRANAVGVDSACIQVCDRYGFCDTTYLIVNAVQPSGNSLTFNDTISVGFGRTTCEVALPTGRITTFTNICPQNSGTNVSFDLDAGTRCVTYRGLTVGTNTACIRACNESGICDTTSISIQVIPYVAPIPTTRFAYRDTMTVGVTRNKCSFNAPVGSVAVFENICAASSGSKVTFTLDQATKCVSYRSIAIGVDSACIRVCNASGQCDTTIMYATVVANNLGSGSGRTITVRDTISIGNSRENCGVSIPTTAISIVNNCPNSSGTNVAFSLDQVRRCVTYRGLTVGEDTACYVACNSNGICDTTIYIVGTVDANIGKKITIRDTISVGSTRTNCAVSIPSGTYASITNDCPNNSGTNVTFVYRSSTRCVDYTGILVGSDTACIKVCNTNGVCDTTTYIITAVENTTSGGGNNCGLRVSPFVQARNCGIKGFINLAVSGSTAPYTFRWADLTGANQPQNRTELEAGNYIVTVSSAATCDTTLTITVINNAVNCGGGAGDGSNRCGLVVVPTAVNKTCAANGSITLAVSGSTAPYSFDWADLAGTTDPQNRTNLEAGIYSVTVTPAVANCDTIIAIVIANNAINCGGGGSGGSSIRQANVTLRAQDSTSFCVDSSRVTGGFTVALSSLQTFSVISEGTPKGCFNIKGFVVGTDVATIILTGQNGVKDTTQLIINVTPRLTGGSSCGLVVNSTVAPKTCAANGEITLAVSGSTLPYTFDWADIEGTNNVLNRSDLQAGSYTVKVSSSASNCDTTLTFIILNDCVASTCGLVVTPTVMPKTCTSDGSITLSVTGSTAPYTFDWTDLTGTTDPQNRTGLAAGTYTVKVTPSVSGCDTTLTIVVANNATNCGGGSGSNIRLATVTVKEGDSTTYCVDSSRVTGGFTVQLSGISQISSTIAQTTPVGCFTIKGFVAGRDSVTIILVGQNGVSDTTQLTTIVTPRDTIVANGCGLVVTPTVMPKTCTSDGSITLSVTGSTAPYTFDWTDLTGTTDPQNRTGLAAGTYTVKVTPSVSGCDTTLTIVVANNATNCNGGTIRFDNVDVIAGDSTVYCADTSRVGTGFAIEVGGTQIFSTSEQTTPKGCFKIKGFVAGRDTVRIVLVSTSGVRDTLVLSVNVRPNSIGSTTFRIDSVTVFTRDSTTYCADSSRVGIGFLVSIFSPNTPIYSVIEATTPPGCVKIRGFVEGRDTVFVILVGQNGTRDTTQLIVKVEPKVVNPTGATRSDTITLKTLEVRNYCPDTSRLMGSSVNLIKFCSIDPFDNTSVRLDTINKCVAIKGLNTGVDTFCIAVCNAAGFCDTIKLFVKVTPDTVTPVSRIDTVRLFVDDMLTYCNIDTGQIRGNVDTIYNICPTSSGTYAKVELTADKCLEINGLLEGTDTACIVVCNRLANLCDTTTVIIIVSKRPSNVLVPREDAITIQEGEIRNYCPDTSRLRGGRVTSISFCSTATFDNAVILLLDSTKCVQITGALIGQDTACLVVCTSTGLCDTVNLTVNVVAERPLTDTTIVVPLIIGQDSLFCGIDTTQLRGLVDTIYDACPGKNGSFARMVIDRVTHCVQITGVRIGQDTMCVVVCNSFSGICDTTNLIVAVRDSVTNNIVVIANDDFDSLRRGTTKVLQVYDNDTIRPRQATLLTIISPPIKGSADTISFRDGLIKYTSTRAPSSCGLDSFRYRVCVDSICDTALVVVIVVCPDSLRAYSAISPNGDGRNDVFLIDGLQNYPDHTVCIFNRWGNQVLNQKNYQNDWSGTWNGANVPDGTYFYFIRDDKKGEIVLTGYLQVLR